MEGVSYVTDYMNLKTTNHDLAYENAQLMNSLPGGLYDKAVQAIVVKDTLLIQQYSYIPAKVINNSTTRRNNYLTLNRGTTHGIQREMGVITGSGVVGIVKDVSEHYCTVMSLLHKNTRISAKFKHNNYFGSLVWDGTDAGVADLKDIARHVQLKKDDTIVTTNYSALFPENILVGTVLSFESKAGDNFYNIKVKLSANFSNITYVYIVNNILKKEQLELEAASVENDN